MVQSRVTLCQAKYRRDFSAGDKLRRTCGESSKQLCPAKCYLRASELEPCPTVEPLPVTTSFPHETCVNLLPLQSELQRCNATTCPLIGLTQQGDVFSCRA